MHAILVSPRACRNDDSDNAGMIVDNDAKLGTMHHVRYVKAQCVPGGGRFALNFADGIFADMAAALA